MFSQASEAFTYYLYKQVISEFIRFMSILKLGKVFNTFFIIIVLFIRKKKALNKTLIDIFLHLCLSIQSYRQLNAESKVLELNSYSFSENDKRLFGVYRKLIANLIGE